MLLFPLIYIYVYSDIEVLQYMEFNLLLLMTKGTVIKVEQMFENTFHKSYNVGQQH